MKTIIIILFFYSANIFAVPVIFRTNKSVLVRTPSGVVAKPGIGQLLETVPSSGGAKANGNFSLTLGKSETPIPVSKSYTPASIAAAAADAILSKTALGLVASLALPYAIDAATDQFMKQVSPEPTAPEQNIVTANPWKYCISGVCGNTWRDAEVAVWGSTFHECSVTYTSGTPPAQTNYTLTGYLYAQLGCNLVRTNAFVSANACPSGTTLHTSDQQCYGTPTCTAPSMYDSITGMCIGSAINEPANAATLAADIEATFNDNPTFPKVALDSTLDADIEPANGDQDVDMPTPQTISGPIETSTRNYNDPATGHPVTEEITKQTDYQVEKSGKNQLDVKPTVSTTTNITDNVTNVTTTVTNTTTTMPSEATTEEPSQTDCEKFPNAVGCLELGDIAAPETLTTTPVDVSISPSSWGSGSCPADVSVAGHFITGAVFSFAPVCQFLTSLAPVLIAVGWLMAGWFVLGGVRD